MKLEELQEKYQVEKHKKEDLKRGKKDLAMAVFVLLFFIFYILFSFL